jgi:hypothetical protein
MVALAQLVDMFDEPPRWPQKLPLYVKALADLPVELLPVAVERCIANLEFFPRPAEIKHQIADELAWRAEDHNNRIAQQQLFLPAPTRAPPTPEELAAHEAKMEAFRREWGEWPKARPGLVARPHCAEPLAPLKPLAPYHLPDVADLPEAQRWLAEMEAAERG